MLRVGICLKGGVRGRSVTDDEVARKGDGGAAERIGAREAEGDQRQGGKNRKAVEYELRGLFLALRRNEPLLPRPFKTPFYPFFPEIALLIALVSLVALTYYNPKLAGIYALMVGVGYVYYVLRDVEDR